MAINKVEFGNQTLIDLTSDTVDSNNLLEGETAHTRSGQSVVGQAHIPTGEIRKATNKFKCFNGGLLEKCVVKLDPVQDLHGYDYPWVGGAGKNILPLTVDTIKSLNGGSSAWNNNKRTMEGVEVELLADGDGNCVGIKVNRTASSSNSCLLNLAFNNFTFMTSGISYTLNGCPSGGSNNSYALVYQAQTGDLYWDDGNGATFTFAGQVTDVTLVRLVIRPSYSPSNMVFKPMIRLASVSDATFEPYTNICSIIPHTQSQVLREGKNELNSTLGIATQSGLTYTPLGDGTYNVNGTSSSNGGADFATNITLPAGTYKITGLPNDVASEDCYIALVSNGLYAYTSKRDSFTLLETTTFESLRFRPNKNNQLNNVIIKPMITKDLSATYDDYEPYKGQLYTLQLGQNVYSAYIDFISGVMTIVGKYVELDGSNDENIVSLDSPKRYGIDIPNDSITMSSAPRQLNGFISNEFSEITDEQGRDGVVGFHLRNNGSHSILVCMGANAPATIADFRTWLSNHILQVVYELATPITVQLTPTQIEALVMENNVSCPLDFQNIDEDGIEYRDLFVWDEVVNEISDAKDDVFEELGFKNLFSYPFVNTTKTTNGITFTDNKDGSITIQGVASDTANFLLAEKYNNHYPQRIKDRRITITGGLSSNCRVTLWRTGGTIAADSGSGATVDFDSSVYDATSFNFAISVKKDADFTTPVTVYPMLRLAEDKDSTYQPYTMTNKELTESVATLNNVTYNSSGNETKTFVLDRKCLYWLVSSHPYTGRHGLFYISTWSNNICDIQTVGIDSNLTLSNVSGNLQVVIGSSATFLSLIKIAKYPD